MVRRIRRSSNFIKRLITKILLIVVIIRIKFNVRFYRQQYIDLVRRSRMISFQLLLPPTVFRGAHGEIILPGSFRDHWKHEPGRVHWRRTLERKPACGLFLENVCRKPTPKTRRSLHYSCESLLPVSQKNMRVNRFGSPWTKKKKIRNFHESETNDQRNRVFARSAVVLARPVQLTQYV